MPNSFESQANIAAFNIGFNIMIQCRPVILPGNQFLGLVNPIMVCKRIVVMLTNQLRSNDFRDVGKTPILEHFYDIYPSFWKVCSPQFSCLIVVALQICEF